ncbi:alanine--tRNA ligase [Kineosporia mesophila]|uniref:Alanine--tRNA ligase n=1 Tax=Kineosporia mesophila TaxID=566012 RepID=A0ABP7AJU2_9ACTN|nr:alanine--tRNA ligase [Kineosporia mesophila]MCD5352463.1 alanine--tRNA ligase [Kineosporia mesophila]
MLSSQIRSSFFDYYGARDHHLVPSGSLIPNDPTLLLANAGMNQFKPYYLGETVPDFQRAMSVQKCARTSDIENVGRTTRHGTFFEMLGNFSFGDYFKAETIAWAWEVLTQVFHLDPGRLWITVYLDDDETERLWRAVGMPAERIQRLGMEDNYWSTGVPGPCGPCSEVCYDRGPAFGPAGGPAVNGERYLEIWNLVFMQNIRGAGDGKGDFSILGDLPAKSIDTGLGLDRIAAILQGVDTICETDLLAPTLSTVQELARRTFPGRDGSRESVSFQVVTEHARSIAFLVADGVLPSNEGRGYVLRRLLRGAVRHARQLGIQRSVLPVITNSVIDNLSPAWPELAAQSSLITQVASAEEVTFDRTLRQGSRLLESSVATAHQQRMSTLTGDTAFELHDTYGFPIDLTIEVAREAGLKVDHERFAILLDEQRRRAKKHGRNKTADALARHDLYRGIAAQHGLTDFVGYDNLTTETRVLALISNDVIMPVVGEGAPVRVVLNRSPFYAEAGGQVGDTGTVTTNSGAVLQITGTRTGIDGLHVHTATVLSGVARTGEIAEAQVDGSHRAAVARSHSATHVLHATLRAALGSHAQQQGSLVAAGRLRFDFAHFSAIPVPDLEDIENRVNDYLMDDPDVRVWHATRSEAEAAGATALFGEKYGDTVRIVDIGDFSRELCGGTHVGHGSQAGPVRILGETSVGASLRRIEALTGADALRYYDHERHLLHELALMLNVSTGQAPRQLELVLSKLATAQHELNRISQVQRGRRAARLADAASQAEGGSIVVEKIEGVTGSELRLLAEETLEQIPGRPAIVILAVAEAGKAQFVASISHDLVSSGFQAHDLLSGAASIIGGGAGGTGSVAQAGGRDFQRIDEALMRARRAGHEVLLQSVGKGEPPVR